MIAAEAAVARAGFAVLAAVTGAVAAGREAVERAAREVLVAFARAVAAGRLAVGRAARKRLAGVALAVATDDGAVAATARRVLAGFARAVAAQVGLEAGADGALLIERAAVDVIVGRAVRVADAQQVAKAEASAWDADAAILGAGRELTGAAVVVSADAAILGAGGALAVLADAIAADRGAVAGAARVFAGLAQTVAADAGRLALAARTHEALVGAVDGRLLVARAVAGDEVVALAGDAVGNAVAAAVLGATGRGLVGLAGAIAAGAIAAGAGHDALAITADEPAVRAVELAVLRAVGRALLDDGAKAQGLVRASRSKLKSSSWPAKAIAHHAARLPFKLVGSRGPTHTRSGSWNPETVRCLGSDDPRRPALVHLRSGGWMAAP